jgi:hypothetical protein
MRAVRWFAVIALATLVVGCSFDPGGTLASDGDDDADAGLADASHAGPIDAAPSLPIDAGQSTPIDAMPQDNSCAEPADCPGALCCSYAGGLAISCASSCLGGEQVCDDISDCSGNDRCCEHLFGPSTCGFCF